MFSSIFKAAVGMTVTEVSYCPSPPFSFTLKERRGWGGGGGGGGGLNLSVITHMGVTEIQTTFAF